MWIIRTSTFTKRCNGRWCKAQASFTNPLIDCIDLFERMWILNFRCQTIIYDINTITGIYIYIMHADGHRAFSLIHYDESNDMFYKMTTTIHKTQFYPIRNILLRDHKHTHRIPRETYRRGFQHWFHNSWTWANAYDPSNLPATLDIFIQGNIYIYRYVVGTYPREQ
jgi:hypothetical protein